MSEIEKYYNGEIIVDFEEETELEKEYNKVAELYSKAVKKKIEYRKEIERLNNIINELEEEFDWQLKKQIDIDKFAEEQGFLNYNPVKLMVEHFKDKLQKLKGDGSNE